MPGGHDPLGEMGAVRPHGLGETGVKRFAHIVVGTMQEEDRHLQLPMGLGTFGEGDVCVAVHVPAGWTKKAITLERGNVAMLILLAQHRGIARQLRRAARCGPNHPPFARTDAVRAGWPLPAGSPRRKRALTVARTSRSNAAQADAKFSR